ncbi:MAG: SDR family oxidoreductase [Rhizobiaceae bacterium]
MMTGQAVLVTGGAKRIGRAIVEDLAAHGFSVAIHANTSWKEASELAEAIRSRGARAVAVQADLSDEKVTRGLIRQVEDALGTVTLLVNNASIFKDDRLQQGHWPDWDAHFAVHVKAPAVLTSQMAERLPDEAEGLVVNLIDQRVWAPTPLNFSYTLSKSALWTATQTMAQALAPRIRVNGLGPGPTLANDRQDKASFRRQAEAVLLKRSPALSEFGATIRWLVEARSVTGQMICLDGGQHLAWETPDTADGPQ